MGEEGTGLFPDSLMQSGLGVMDWFFDGGDQKGKVVVTTGGLPPNI